MIAFSASRETLFPISLVEALNNTPQIDVDELLNYDSVKSHLTMQIVSTEYTAEKLADVPHKEIQDMSIVYRIDLANDTYGGERERPSHASKRLGWVVGVNDSNFSWETNRPVYDGVCIKDRKIMEGSAANGMEICLVEDGTLFSPDEGTSGEELLTQGVTDTWSCGDTLLIQDGEAVNVGIQSNQYRYPRTAIGMVEPGEYYLITAGYEHYKGGMTYDDVRDVLLSHGCTYGKCMDGGGSSTLVFANEVINVPAEGSGRERAVEDFLYFSERAAIR